MKFERLPSGSYRVRMTFNGKRHSVVFDHKPTEAEVMKKFSEKIDTVIDCQHITFEVAAQEYCKLKKNVISPNTYAEYKNTPDRLSKTFVNMYIDEIDGIHIQKEINDLTPGRRPKTVKNYYSFIMQVINMYRKDFHPYIKLPQGAKIEPYIPTDEEVRLLFEQSKNDAGGMFYIAIVLGCYGLRRSEIAALSPSDFDGNIVTINKAMIKSEGNKWIIRDYPKNDTSNRKIPVPSEIVQMINALGFVYKGHPNSISDYISRFCTKNGIQHFSLHKLRHYFVSRLASENIDTETIISLSGHKTDYVMKNIYRHPISKKVEEASNKLNDILFSEQPNLVTNS